MYFESIGELWHMAGHGTFVWSAYGISALVLVCIIVQPLLRFRAELKRLQVMSTKNNKPGASASDTVALDGLAEANIAQSNVSQANVEQAKVQVSTGVKS